jgi:hypothetical protein
MSLTHVYLDTCSICASYDSTELETPNSSVSVFECLSPAGATRTCNSTESQRRFFVFRAPTDCDPRQVNSSGAVSLGGVGDQSTCRCAL